MVFVGGDAALFLENGLQKGTGNLEGTGKFIKIKMSFKTAVDDADRLLNTGGKAGCSERLFIVAQPPEKFHKLFRSDQVDVRDIGLESFVEDVKDPFAVAGAPGEMVLLRKAELGHKQGNKRT